MRVKILRAENAAEELRSWEGSIPCICKFYGVCVWGGGRILEPEANRSVSSEVTGVSLSKGESSETAVLCKQ